MIYLPKDEEKAHTIYPLTCHQPDACTLQRGTDIYHATFQEPTSTPQTVDVSEIGSTDGIIVLGGVLVLIVLVPIFLYRKSWMHTSSP